MKDDLDTNITEEEKLATCTKTNRSVKVKTDVEFSGVPAGTTAEAERDGKLWKVTWDLPNRSRPLVDWFDEGEFHQYLKAV